MGLSGLKVLGGLGSFLEDLSPGPFQIKEATPILSYIIKGNNIPLCDYSSIVISLCDSELSQRMASNFNDPCD